jgi:hypothetical protein
LLLAGNIGALFSTTLVQSKSPFLQKSLAQAMESLT